jgi:hypothetical protein
MRLLENQGKEKVGSGLAKTVTCNSYSVKRRSVPVIWTMIWTEAGLSCRQPVRASSVKIILSNRIRILHNEKYRIDMGIGSVRQPTLSSDHTEPVSRLGVNVASDAWELSIDRAKEEAPGLALKYILFIKRSRLISSSKIPIILFTPQLNRARGVHNAPEDLGTELRNPLLVID